MFIHHTGASDFLVCGVKGETCEQVRANFAFTCNQAAPNDAKPRYIAGKIFLVRSGKK